MTSCDVLIVGGGPAGSSCAWKLGRAGYDVVVVDRATFPRDKVCAGWITPQIVGDLELDLDHYRSGRTLQPITGFRTSVIGRNSDVETRYEKPVSYGIRRCEFDNYLLQRSGARLLLGEPARIRRVNGEWVVNDRVRVPMLVGAGGHFCPIARELNGPVDGAPIVAAQEVECAIDWSEATAPTVQGDMPELYFTPDMSGYGWCFRKGHHLNVGIGCADGRSVRSARSRFLEFLAERGTLVLDAAWQWRGHAYLLAGPPRRRVFDDGVLLAGDAAGLAYPQSGEGIRPAIESGLMAAATIVDADHQYGRDRLHRYQDKLRDHFALRATPTLARAIPPAVGALAARQLLARVPWFVRNVLLDRWFLHAN